RKRPPTVPVRPARAEVAASEQHGHECAVLLEADLSVHRPGGRVVICHVETDRGRHALERMVDDGSHPGHGKPSSALRRLHPNALYLAGMRRDRTDLRLEDNAITVDPGQGSPRLDKFPHPGSIQGPSVTG